MSNHEQWHLSPEAAERYERVVARYILGPWAPLLVDAADIAARERVLDIACGTGVVARVAAERVGPEGRVVGIDLNPGMIEVARGSTGSRRGRPFEWIECSALDLQLPDASSMWSFASKAYSFSRTSGSRCARCGVYLLAWRTGCAQRLEQHRVLQQRRRRGTCKIRRRRHCRPLLCITASSRKEELERLARTLDFSRIEVQVRMLDVHLPRRNSSRSIIWRQRRSPQTSLPSMQRFAKRSERRSGTSCGSVWTATE